MRPFTHYEISMIGEFYDPDGPTTDLQRIDPDEVRELFDQGVIASAFWALYGRYEPPAGENSAMHISDFQSFEAARDMYERITGKRWEIENGIQKA